jgi:predicted amidophosphoribosyltransferase
VVFAAGAYRGALARAIRRYKYQGDRRLAPAFAAMLATLLRSRPTWFEEFDVITAVPTFTGPGARRPWDPVGTVLSELARRVGAAWAVEPGLVIKTAETPGMAGRDWGSRQAVARGPLRRALTVPPGVQVAGARILVVDDVLAEGSTLREVAGALRHAGATDVAGLVLARPTWAPERPARPAM